MGSLSFDTALEALRDRLDAKGIEHSLRVAESASTLARMYEVDEYEARLAGLLHDWDRNLSADELREAATEHGIEVDQIDEQVPYLLHAHTASADLRTRLPGVPDSVLDAIASHTVGSIHMSDLDKVVYIADMVEPSRTFSGVDGLRTAMGTVTLDELFIRAYSASIERLVHRRRPIHPQTVAVWNAHVSKGRV